MFVEHKEAVEITEAPAKVLKLSEAIRIGCKMTNPGRDHYVKQGSACALGAAMLATGMSEDDANIFGIGGLVRKIPDVWDALSAFCRKNPWSVQTANDRRFMTREQIADRLESQGY